MGGGSLNPQDFIPGGAEAEGAGGLTVREGFSGQDLDLQTTVEVVVAPHPAVLEGDLRQAVDPLLAMDFARSALDPQYLGLGGAEGEEGSRRAVRCRSGNGWPGVRMLGRG